ncbi:MAG: Quaternary ammonium compound-resistance protein SugE [Candidatus Omnitrophica bacterium]|nr:Quaternary ammonium compound-resistance protein SugE [Candidatus Omnitrophota bacterium]
MKASNGFTRPLPTAVTLAAMVASFLLLSAALKTLPVGTAYAVWTGVGAFGTAVIGLLFLNEPATLVRVVSLCLIVIGIVGLKHSA